jgi:L-seryl-tRNA(Ser) seleniumtransferase/D-glucosaminate-6-phosphate ammonia-lyase
MNVYEKLGLPRVINASGKMTALGVSTISEEVAQQMNEAAMSYVNIEALYEKAGKEVAKYTGAEDACITSSAAAGIAISVAASITGEDLSKIEKLPISTGMRNEIVIQKGHIVNFGAPVAQMITLGGGIPVEVGQSNHVEAFHIESAINENTAALFYVKSHHAVQKGIVSIEKMIEIAHSHKLPLIIDSAAEEDIRKYYAMGADLVIYSGAKAIEGCTSGFITGKADLIRACRLQYKGIGRAMKIGKENIMGIVKAVEIYSSLDNTEAVKLQKEKMEWLIREVNKLKGLKGAITQDEAGREIYRAEIKIDKNVLGVDAYYVMKELQRGNPQVYVRDYYVSSGRLSIDPRPLGKDEEKIIVEKLKEVIKRI